MYQNYLLNSIHLISDLEYLSSDENSEVSILVFVVLHCF